MPIYLTAPAAGGGAAAHAASHAHGGSDDIFLYAGNSLDGGCENIPRAYLNNGATLPQSQLLLAYLTPDRAIVAGHILLLSSTLGVTTPTNQQVAIYTEDTPDGALTRVAVSANFTTLFTASTEEYIALTSTYTTVPGTRIAVCFVMAGYGTAPKLVGNYNLSATNDRPSKASGLVTSGAPVACPTTIPAVNILPFSYTIYAAVLP